MTFGGSYLRGVRVTSWPTDGRFDFGLRVRRAMRGRQVRSGPGQAGSAHVLRCDPSSSQWTEEATPGPRAGHHGSGGLIDRHSALTLQARSPRRPRRGLLPNRAGRIRTADLLTPSRLAEEAETPQKPLPPPSLPGFRAFTIRHIPSRSFTSYRRINPQCRSKAVASVRVHGGGQTVAGPRPCGLPIFRRDRESGKPGLACKKTTSCKEPRLTSGACLPLGEQFEQICHAHVAIAIHIGRTRDRCPNRSSAGMSICKFHGTQLETLQPGATFTTAPANWSPGKAHR